MYSTLLYQWSDQTQQALIQHHLTNGAIELSKHSVNRVLPFLYIARHLLTHIANPLSKELIPHSLVALAAGVVCPQYRSEDSLHQYLSHHCLYLRARHKAIRPCTCVSQLLLVVLLPAQWARALVYPQETLERGEALLVEHVRAAKNHLLRETERIQTNGARLCAVAASF
jgi:hypothetical protein